MGRNERSGIAAVGVGEAGQYTIMPTAFGGHAYYVRKCVTGAQVTGGDFWRRHLDGIELPDAMVERSLMVEVVGIGPRVGEWCNKAHQIKFGRIRRMAEVAAVGDVLLCPDDNPGIKRSPLADWEFFIEESVPLAIVPVELLAKVGG
jgi:hypothetical protein